MIYFKKIIWLTWEPFHRRKNLKLEIQEKINFANKMMVKIKSYEEGNLNAGELGKLAVAEGKKLKSYSTLHWGMVSQLCTCTASTVNTADKEVIFQP